ncbi:hypothetical protein [Actinophytocola xanthii]|uniref:Uncharacterized protein n=1 Tax=Actinophytocola xanthii TaxID=1912961 RepID=A0A1Q8C2I3_9PSEU|nr:hypothetical protein [Actinophytocola xanthii]OLF08575.1 hypothetical protein BU204_34345 [Actinophytocola xanthii]
MDADVRQQIREAAAAAARAVGDTAQAPDGHSGAVFIDLDRVEDLAREKYWQTLRDKCAEFGVDERDYWLANPVEAIMGEPECLADDLPRITDDLAAAASLYTEPPY